MVFVCDWQDLIEDPMFCSTLLKTEGKAILELQSLMTITEVLDTMRAQSEVFSWNKMKENGGGVQHFIWVES